jgi:hypothetical protein
MTGTFKSEIFAHKGAGDRPVGVVNPDGHAYENSEV